MGEVCFDGNVRMLFVKAEWISGGFCLNFDDYSKA